eukprot:PhM_4_TR14186/c2_g1_i1/m.80764
MESPPPPPPPGSPSPVASGAQSPVPPPPPPPRAPTNTEMLQTLDPDEDSSTTAAFLSLSVLCTSASTLAKIFFHHLRRDERAKGPLTSVALTPRHLVFVNPHRPLCAEPDVLDRVLMPQPVGEVPQSVFDLARIALLRQKDASVAIFGDPRSGKTSVLRAMLHFLCVAGCIDVTQQQRKLCSDLVMDLVSIVPALEQLLSPFSVCLGYEVVLEQEYCSLVGWEVFPVMVGSRVKWAYLSGAKVPTRDELTRYWAVELGFNEKEVDALGQAFAAALDSPDDAPTIAMLVEVATVMVNRRLAVKARIDAMAEYTIRLLEIDSDEGVAAPKVVPLPTPVAEGGGAPTRLRYRGHPNLFLDSRYAVFCVAPYPADSEIDDLQQQQQQQQQSQACDVVHVRRRIEHAMEVYHLSDVLQLHEACGRRRFDLELTNVWLFLAAYGEVLRRRCIWQSYVRETLSIVRNATASQNAAVMLFEHRSLVDATERVSRLRYNAIMRELCRAHAVDLHLGLHDGAEHLHRHNINVAEAEDRMLLCGEAAEEHHSLRCKEVVREEAAPRGIIVEQRLEYLRRMAYMKYEIVKHAYVSHSEAEARQRVEAVQRSAWFVLVREMTAPYTEIALEELQAAEELERVGWKGVGGIEVQERAARQRILEVLAGTKLALLQAAQFEHRMVLEIEQQMDFEDNVAWLWRRLGRVTDRATVTMAEYAQRRDIEAEEDTTYAATIAHPHAVVSVNYVVVGEEPHGRASLVDEYIRRTSKILFRWECLGLRAHENTARRCLAARLWLEFVALYSREDVAYHEVVERTRRSDVLLSAIEEEHTLNYIESRRELHAAQGQHVPYRMDQLHEGVQAEGDGAEQVDALHELMEAHGVMSAVSYYTRHQQDTLYGRELNAAAAWAARGSSLARNDDKSATAAARYLLL